MKVLHAALLPLLVIAAPSGTLKARQGAVHTGHTSNELIDGSECRPLILIFARGSTQPGNLGQNLGPAMCNQLKSAYGAARVACQGVGGAYHAHLFSNFEDEGTTPEAIAEGQKMFNAAKSKCPKSRVVGSGYSQGAAVITGAVPSLPNSSKKNLVAIVMFGSTRTDEENGMIPGYPSSNTLNICARNDGVCDGGLDVTLGHTHYLGMVPTAVRFMQGRIADAGGI